MADPWSVVSQAPAPSSPYETEAQFRARMDKTFGPGKWRETSGYRDPTHNRSVGGVPGSAHTRGSPDAPGAHDIVVPGMSETAAAAKLPRDYRTLPEGRVGAEGPHIHIEDANPWAVASEAPAKDPWAVVSQAPGQPQPAPKPQPRPTAAPQATPMGPMHRRAHEALEDLRAIGREPPSPLDPTMAAYATAARVGSDLFGLAASPVGGAVEAGAHHLPQQALAYGELGVMAPKVGPKSRFDPSRVAGDVAEAAIPIPGFAEGKAAQEGAGAARAIGRDVAGVIGKEANPAERVDNALYRLGQHDTASRIEALETLRQAPRSVLKANTQERLSHAIEARLKDPKATIPEDLKEAEAVRAPWAERQRVAVNALRGRLAERGLSEGEIEEYAPDTGYLPRYVVGKAPKFDLHLPGEKPKGMGAGFPTRTPSTKQRVFSMVGDEAGGESFTPGHPSELGEGARPATMQEIEANTPIRYHKNALVNTVARALQDEQAVRNLDVLDEITKNMKEAGLAHRDEWRYRDPSSGQLVVARANEPRPEGFADVPHIPQLRGWSFDPRIAEVLKDYRPPPGEPIDDILARANRLLTASIFVTPFPHIANVGGMWTVGRGWDWLNPAGYPRLMKTGSEAIKQVLTMGPTYRRMMREGSAMMAADDATRNFYDVLMKKAGGEIAESPDLHRQITSAFPALKALNPVQLGKMLYQASHKVLWNVNDMLLLQRQLELMSKGSSERDAIAEAERWIANYRVPPRVLGQRWAQQALTKNHWLVFGRYEYGKWRALGEMLKPFLKGDAAGSVDAAGKVAIMALMMGFGYPLMDAMWAQITGNKNARVKRGGETAMPDAVLRLAQGQRDFSGMMASMVSPSPLVEGLPEVVSNRYLWSGQPIIEPKSSTLGKAVQAADFVGEYAMPLQMLMNAARYGAPGVDQQLGRLVGVDLPRRAPGETGKQRRYLTSEAKRREKKDPLESELGTLTR